MGFKEEYAKFPQPSSAREAFVLKSILSLPKDQIVSNMKPITITRPDGAKITYKVMPDYVSIDGIRIPMSGATAQRVANHFGLSLPNAKMSKEIYDNSDVKVNAKPLSGSGTTIDGKSYSGADVVRTGVGYAPFALNYNDVVNKQLSQQGAKKDQIVSGFAKDIIAPVKKNQLGLYGFYDKEGKPIQGGTGSTPHDSVVHTEYGSFARLVSPDVTITYPDGRVEKQPLDSIYQINRYNDNPIELGGPANTNNKRKSKPGTEKLMDKIDFLLNQLKAASVR